MRILRNLEHCPEEYRHSVIALGNFDGVHKGHKAILQECVAVAKKLHARPAVMTFEPHPRMFFCADKKPVSIFTFSQKAICLAREGIEHIFVLRFNEKLAATSARDFIEGILHQSLGVRHVLTGNNFAFGKGRAGNTDMLAGEAARLGFGYSALPAICDDTGDIISTSAVRAALTQGDVQKAARMLGHAYFIEGRVCHGSRRGQTIGFPTANLHASHLFTPCFGVYAVRMCLRGRWYQGVANLGVKPTFGDHSPMLEVHIFDFSESIYGQKIQVEFVKFIRPEQTFPGIDQLRAQIAADVTEAKKQLGEYA